MYIVSTDTQKNTFNVENDLRVIYKVPFAEWGKSPITGQNRKLFELLLNLCIVANRTKMDSMDVGSLCTNLSSLLDEIICDAIDNMKNS